MLLYFQTEVDVDVESAVGPYKSDNAKLIRENNEMHQTVVKQKEEADTAIRGDLQIDQVCVTLSEYLQHFYH